MKTEWVIGKYTGERAKSVAAQADAGIGYIIVDSFGTGVNREIIAAFRLPIDGLIPEHLQVVEDPHKIEKYNKMLRERMGLHDGRTPLSKMPQTN